MAGGGKLSVSGPVTREPVRVAFDYFKVNVGRVSASVHPIERDFHLYMVELQNAGAPEALTLASFIVLCSAVLGNPVQSQMVAMGRHVVGRDNHSGTEPGGKPAGGVWCGREADLRCRCRA